MRGQRKLLIQVGKYSGFRWRYPIRVLPAELCLEHYSQMVMRKFLWYLVILPVLEQGSHVEVQLENVPVGDEVW